MINEIFLILMEECAETIQAISKIQRFGLDNMNLNTNKTNRQHLTEEIGDLIAMVELLENSNIINSDEINNAKIKKFQKLKTWSNIKID